MTQQWRRIDVDGAVPLVAGRTGTGADPIVALHGLTADHRWFGGVARHLRHGAGVLAPDLRGRGQSAKPLFGYGLHEHARDVIRMLDQEGIDRATLVGHSMGGYVALEVALRYPDRVSGIVLLDSGWPRPPVPILAPNAATLFFGIGDALRRVAAASPAEYNAVQQDVWWVSVAAPTARELTGVTCPVTLIRASEGFTPGSPPLIDPRTLHDIRTALPHLRDVLLQGADHSTMLLDPRFARRVAAEIDRFQRQIDARAAGEIT